MKSSDTCVTSGTAIDSIKILKNVNVTGIIDVDNPSVIINTYPNPINKKISITGLLATKNYMIVVTDNLGNRIMQKSSRGVSSITIYSEAWSTGPYWISIYDKNKNRLIGSMRIVKQ